MVTLEQPLFSGGYLNCSVVCFIILPQGIKAFMLNLLEPEQFPFMNRFKFLNQVESKTSQFEIVLYSLERFSTHFRVKVHKLRKFGDKLRNR